MKTDSTIASKCETLLEYYEQIYNFQSTAHKKTYMLVHEEIKHRLQECQSYTELGIMQGATLAIALLHNIKSVSAYDISLKLYNKAKHLFETYAFENEIDLKIYEMDSTLQSIDPVDLLYIDSKHEYEHLVKELILHGTHVNKYIIFHDTTSKTKLKKAIHEYIKENNDWKIITECDINVGFITIGKLND